MVFCPRRMDNYLGGCFKSSPGVEVCWMVAPPAVTPSAVGWRLAGEFS